MYTSTTAKFFASAMDKGTFNNTRKYNGDNTSIQIRSVNLSFLFIFNLYYRTGYLANDGEVQEYTGYLGWNYLIVNLSCQSHFSSPF